MQNTKEICSKYDLEGFLKNKGYIIEKEENALVSCEKNGCFDEAGWFIEGNFYCEGHKAEMLEILKQIDERVEEELQKKKGIIL